MAIEFGPETNLDDLPGEVVGYTTEQLMKAGALDAFLTPIQMKKNRPGVMITVLCDEPMIGEMESILSRDDDPGIPPLSGQPSQAETPGGGGRDAVRQIREELGFLEGRPPAFSPEHDEYARLASEHGVPLRDIHDAAQSVPGASGRTDPSGSRQRLGVRGLHGLAWGGSNLGPPSLLPLPGKVSCHVSVHLHRIPRNRRWGGSLIALVFTMDHARRRGPSTGLPVGSKRAGEPSQSLRRTWRRRRRGVPGRMARIEPRVRGIPVRPFRIDPRQGCRGRGDVRDRHRR